MSDVQPTKKSPAIETKVEVKKELETPNILRVSDKKTWEVIEIDWNKEKDWKTKYNHWSGVEFPN